MARVLIVEDEYIIAKAIQISLRRHGYDVLEPVGDAAAAVSTARNERPDFVLMDVHLSGKADGLDAAAEIHAEMNIPIIMMSGYSDAEIVERATAVNAVAYLVKPITPEQVREAIEKSNKTPTDNR